MTNEELSTLRRISEVGTEYTTTQPSQDDERMSLCDRGYLIGETVWLRRGHSDKREKNYAWRLTGNGKLALKNYAAGGGHGC